MFFEFGFATLQSSIVFELPEEIQALDINFNPINETLMRHSLFFLSIVLLAFMCMPACKQQQQKQQELNEQQTQQQQQENGIPQSWTMRLDKPSAENNGVEFTANDGVLHFISGASGAAIYYKPEMKTSGTFSIVGKFTQTEKGEHAEAYGLFIGGNNLQQENQQYLYFLMRQDGKYLIKSRTGSNTKSIVGWTKNEAVKPMPTSDPVTNSLKIANNGENISFWVNGTMIKQISASQLQYTKGIVGLRINHHLNVKVTEFNLAN